MSNRRVRLLPGILIGLCLWAAPATAGDPIIDAATAAEGRYVLVEFTSTTCPACDEMGPVVDDVLTRFPGLHFQEHDADLEVELAKKYKVRCVPVYVVVDPKGEVRFNDVGMRTSEELAEILETAGVSSR